MSLETLPNPEFYPEWKDWANALLREIKSEPEPSLNSDSISAFDESAQDAVGLALTDTVTVNFTYDDALHQISAIVIDDSISNAKLANMVQATFKMRAAAAGTGDPIDGTAAQAKTALAIVAADLSDFAEAVQDTIGAAATDSTTIDFTYDDGAGTLTADVKADSITYALLQDVSATARLLGRITAGAGDTEELTGTQATTLLNVFTDALKGLAPASGGGTDNFLRADGTWDEPPGTGGGGGAWALAGTGQTATGVYDFAVDGAKANIDFAGLGSFNELLILGRGLTTSVLGVRQVLASVDDGVSFYNTSGDYVTVDGAGVEANSPGFGNHSTTATAARTLIFQIFNTKGAAKLAKCTSLTVHQVLFVASASDINAIRVNNSGGGNITGGTVRVYAR